MVATAVKSIATSIQDDHFIIPSELFSNGKVCLQKTEKFFSFKQGVLNEKNALTFFGLVSLSHSGLHVGEEKYSVHSI